MFKERFKLRVRDAKDHILQLYEASATTEKAEEEIDLTGEDLVKQRDEDSVVDPQVEGGDTQEMQSGVYADAEEGPSDEYKYDEEQAVARDRCRCAAYDGREAKVKALRSDMKGAKQQVGLAYSQNNFITMLSDGVLLAISLGGLAATVLLLLSFAGFFAGTKKVAHEDQAEVVRGGERGGLAALRKRKDRKKRNAEREEPADPAEAVDPAQNEAMEAAEDEEGPVEPRAMTKKELQKELKRREREELRQFDQQQREERQRIVEEKEAVYQKKHKEEAKIEAALEEQERKLKEEKERKEKEEFDQWKDMFTIEEQGTKLVEDSEESQTLLQQFVDYVKSHKVVLLEDLASEFNLATQEAIDRVESLQKSNRLTGIVDDRGKFIYITEEEMDKVAKFIQRRGRLGFSELSKECNKLIRLDGEADQNKTSSLDWLNSEEQPEEAADLST
ncbi:hypothetical protein PI124_g7156 [Phytophthora idaei]|nr:hypothetical protein PI124_g7156 [Phytophthora idaei]